MKTIIAFLLLISFAFTGDCFAQYPDLVARHIPAVFNQPETTKLDANGDTLLLVEQSMSRPEAYRPEITQDRWVNKRDYEDSLPVFLLRGQLAAILRRLEHLEASAPTEK